MRRTLEQDFLLVKKGRAYGLVLGQSGKGRAYHPWDNLKSCPKCGANAAWAVGKDDKTFESGAPYKVKCLKCGHQSTTFDDWKTCKEDWNKR